MTCWDLSATRREFVRSGCRAFGAFAVASALRDVARAGFAAAAGDYRALVCVFLGGGNDGNNVVVPRTGTEYARYASLRGRIALPSSQLLPLTPATPDGRDYGLHPSLGPLRDLFAAQKLAFVLNVGPLVAPITKSQFDDGSVPTPPQLFSHSDQTTHWQTSLPDRPGLTGWGGRTADVLRDLSSGSVVPMSLSIAGANTFQVGDVVVPYHVSTDGAPGLSGYDPGPRPDPRSRGVRELFARAPRHLFERAFRDVTARALEANLLVRDALAAAPPLRTAFPDTDLGRQLQMAARLIAVRGPLGLYRQIFFCATGGYDTHEGQLDAQTSLLGELADALGAFYRATVELAVDRSVVTFTASDFGRALTSNGGGSDHGWGGHHLVLGGAVRGGDFYGRFPTLALDGPEDAGDGRWIPTTSVDAYAATLSRWLGLAPSELPRVFPNLGRFDRQDLGFL